MAQVFQEKGLVYIFLATLPLTLFSTESAHSIL